ncbi:MAG: sugar phosphate isomerase/epimerase [Planctomycetes bacterium]|nr:sugar phosphate isomerase/epimerase [Planctomycetota bacterium]
MYYTGFADEAGDSIDIQIKATKEMGWEYIEARNIEGVNITDISDEKFDVVYSKMIDAGIKINCFGSTIANYCKDPRKEEDFQKSIKELKRAIPRMKKLGTKMIRGMSFAAVKDEEPDSPDIEKIVFEKVNFLVRICEDAGILYLHENCMNYGGMSYKHTLNLANEVKSPNFKLVFDTGNPVFTYEHIGENPYKKQSSWEFYKNVRDYIYYVHIKDCRYISETHDIFPNVDFTFPGEGDASVREIVKDLIANQYDGGFSIEPHLAVVLHNKELSAGNEMRYKNYVEYGRRFATLVDDIKESYSKRLDF